MHMDIRRLMRWPAAFACVLAGVVSFAAGALSERERIEDTMQRATRFMVETVNHEGGFVWSRLPDLSRRCGELEASPTMIWIQPPGTVSMGEVFLEAHAATGEACYCDAAVRTARAHPGPASFGRVELLRRLRRRGVAACVVRHRRAQRVAPRGVSRPLRDTSPYRWSRP